jgi:glycine cleavage system H protein
MSHLPSHLKYAASHEWISIEDDNIIRVGITAFAQEELGDLVYIELPELGRHVEAQEQCAIVESVKTASDLYSPVSGEIVAINESLNDEPEQINDSPYESWIFSVKADNLTDLKLLLDAEAYQQLINQ